MKLASYFDVFGIKVMPITKHELGRIIEPLPVDDEFIKVLEEEQKKYREWLNNCGISESMQGKPQSSVPQQIEASKKAVSEVIHKFLKHEWR